MHSVAIDDALANDVVVVLKTGATEIYGKLSIHLATTFASFPDHLI